MQSNLNLSATATELLADPANQLGASGFCVGELNR